MENIVLIALGLAVVLCFFEIAFLKKRIEEHENRFARLERGPVRTVSKETNPMPAVHEEVLELKRSGKSIQAIKRLRQINPDWSLKECKDYVEQLE